MRGKMESLKPLVYIILVNYKGYADTIDCVNSLLKINYDNYKIVIVENASSDAALIKENQFINANATVLYAQENKGFSEGNNIGIRYAMRYNPDYLLLLNNDTVVQSDFLNQLVKTAETQEKIGIVTGRIYYYKNQDALWYSGGHYNRSTGKTNQVLYDKSVGEEKTITFASGCLMLISNECIQKVGLLDDSYFMYSEDADYCCRVCNAGLKIVWNPKSIIYHKVSASVGDNSPFQQYYITRNNFIMTRKYGNKKIKAYLNRLLQCVKDILKGRLELKIAIWAYIDFLKGKIGASQRFV